MIVGKAAKSNIFWFLSNKEPSNEAILLGVSSTKMLFTNCLLLCLHSVLLLAYTPTKDIKTSQYISIASNLFAMMKTTIGTGYSIVYVQYITMYFYFFNVLWVFKFVLWKPNLKMYVHIFEQIFSQFSEI